MKRLLIALSISPGLSLGAPFDMLINQRNIADTATIQRVAHITPGVYNLWATDRNTNLPMLVTLSNPFDIQSGVLMVSLTWGEILNKPVFAQVATSGDYNDLTNKPSVSAQINSDWSATSGIEEILNKPSLAPVATSGAYADLSGAPSIPAAQVNSDWSATSGAAQILNKPIRAQSSATRALNSVFQVSSTRDAIVQYSVQATITASISGGQDGDVFLDIASDSGFTTNVQSLDVAPCSQSYTLAIALQGVQKCAAQVRGYVPAGYYARIRTVNNVGSPVFAYRLGQEVLQ